LHGRVAKPPSSQGNNGAQCGKILCVVVPSWQSIFSLFLKAMSAVGSYWNDLFSMIQSLSTGLKITLQHFLKARKSRKPVAIYDPTYFQPVTGRYRLHNEIDDCIVCDKCAKICPVNCITIEPIRAVEEIGKTSDGTSKRIYAATFDINMSQCCFCGLCTTVCPTECLTMTKVYDFSVTDIREHTYAFAEMTTEEIQNKKSALEQFQKAKLEAGSPAKQSENIPPATTPSADPVKPPSAKPVFRPKIKPPGQTPPAS
jgi:formate hydrogenlyase subunit 6/NADH:ubiquinone oxidoreductase subunit I